MSSYDDIKKALENEKAAMASELERSIVKKTVANLIKIEKKSMYGDLTGGKKAKIDKVILDALAVYKEETNATKENQA